MKVSLSWLRRYVFINAEIEDLVTTFTMLGLEVSNYYDRFDYLSEVIVGRIIDCKKHVGINSLFIYKVDCNKKKLSIISDINGLASGMLVAVVLPGSILYNDCILNEVFKKEVNKKGIVFDGFFCNEKELGLGIKENHNLSYLLENLSLGVSIKKGLDLFDFVLDIELTPNRPDCASIIGIAREYGSTKNIRYKKPLLKETKFIGNTCNLFSVDVRSSSECKKYIIRMIDSVKVGPSPFWVQDSLVSVGIKPVNNIVDITNFVMIETGQPLHVFDYDQLICNTIVIDKAKGGETLRTLDNKKRRIPNGVLTVFDSNKPISICGIIGGLNTMVTTKTRKILIECAYFDPIIIRKASRALGVTTDASYRFERGVDINGISYALKRASDLIVELSYGKVINEFINVSNIRNNKKNVGKIIDFDINKTNKVLGTTLNKGQIDKFLSSIDFICEKNGEDKLRIEVPSFRIDIDREEDLVEEVARLYGYKNIPFSLPKFNILTSDLSKIRQQKNKIKSVLSSLGYSEVLNYSFSNIESINYLKIPKNDERNNYVKILNPISSKQNIMRTSLIPGILENINNNIANGLKNLKFFEIGRIYISTSSKKLPKEIEMLVAIWTGDRGPTSWCESKKNCDFFDIKGTVEELFDVFKIRGIKFTKKIESSSCYMKTGHSATINYLDKKLGLVGELDESIVKSYFIKQKVFILEIKLENFYNIIPNSNFLSKIVKFPPILRDVTILIDEKIEFGKLFNKILMMKEKLIDDIYLLNVYKNDKKLKNKKSISFRIIYRSQRHTLDDITVNKIHVSLVQSLVKEFDAELP